jgi:hypothetical protein
MRARRLLLGILVAGCLVSPADLSWAGKTKVTGYPWTGTGNRHGRQDQQFRQWDGNHHGWWNQRDRPDGNGDSRNEGWFNHRDRDFWPGKPHHGSWNDDRDDRGRHERFQPPWGGPLNEGGPVGW